MQLLHRETDPAPALITQDSDVIREEPTDWNLIDPSLTKDRVAPGHEDVKSIVQVHVHT